MMAKKNVKSTWHLASICEQVKREPTMDAWYCGNPPKHLVNGKTLCTFHANKLRN